MPTNTPPVLMWFRRDLRLCDHAALSAAAAQGPVIPVFILDPETRAIGAAPRMRLGLSIQALAQDLAGQGSRLILRQGAALDVLRDLARETGARAVHWSRLYDPIAIARDTEVKAGLQAGGLSVTSHAGHVLHEPWTVETKTGGFYKVYTPYWRAVRDRDVRALRPAPKLAPPQTWPASDDLARWRLADDMRRAAPILATACTVGAAAAQARLDEFCAGPIAGYANDRDLPSVPATSGLSENLTYGEISPERIWHAGAQAMAQGRAGAETFLKELVWRDFATHLVYHSPHITERPWREGWEQFPWNADRDNPDFRAWCAGQTGEALVDAGMRQLWVSGVMHNRVRMVVASYLTKHLMVDWRLGMDWFADQLIDWDPASNAMGWQWVAGCGPDAAPFFRVFNPSGQADKFDADHAYRRRYLAEGLRDPGSQARAYYDVIPQHWGRGLGDGPPHPIVDLAHGRKRALAAYEVQKTATSLDS